jgi:hypothetical protein
MDLKSAPFGDEEKKKTRVRKRGSSGLECRIVNINI